MPTWLGWSVIGSVLLITVVLALLLSYPILNVNHPVGSGYLVVEGWMSREQLSAAADLFSDGEYDGLLVTGGPIAPGSYLNVHYPNLATEAEIGAEQFRLFGVSPVHAVARPSARKDRTYSSALALRKWLAGTRRQGASVDIVSSGPHCRRSWMLFSIALEGIADVGVIAVKPSGYDPSRWWTTSTGVRAMLGELIAYGYAKFLFYPDLETDLETLYREG